MILKLPTWAIGHDADFAIRKVCEGTYAYIELTKEVRKFLTAFADYGDKGEIVLPQAAMAEANTASKKTRGMRLAVKKALASMPTL